MLCVCEESEKQDHINGEKGNTEGKEGDADADAPRFALVAVTRTD